MYKGPELFGTPQKFVMDPVHGAISYFEHEGDVINHPLFQRLRYINQTDILSYVFPGATHTRFIHSIGTMHIAGRLFKKVIRSANAQNLSDNNFEINKEQREAIQYFNACLRLAALLHDSGHAPFSHQFEHAVNIKKILNNKDTFRNLWKDIDLEAYYSVVPTEIVHEHYSVRVAHKILSDIKIPEHGIEIIDVLSIMETTDCAPSSKFTEHAKCIFSTKMNKDEIDEFDDVEIARSVQYLLKDMISGEIDVDKMDYLLRDSYFSGAMHGIYNIDHIINNLMVAPKPAAFRNGKPRFSLAITSKGLGALEEFIHSRYKLYIMMYNHKTCVGFTWLLEKAMNEVLSNEKYLKLVEVFLSDINRFTNFTDTFFYEKFRKISVSNNKSASYRLIMRQKLKFLDSKEEIGEEEIYRIKDKLEHKFGNSIFRTFNVKFSNIMPKFEKMMVLNKDRNSGKYTLNEITKQTDFFNKFDDKQIVYYFKEPELK